MPRRVDHSDAVRWVFKERLPRSHRLEDALLALDAGVVVDDASLGNQANQGLRFVRVELVHHEDPGGRWVCVDGPGDVGDEVLLVSGGPDRGGDGLSGHDVEVRDEAQRAVALVLELDALDQSGTGRFRGLKSFERLDAGLLVGADDVPAFGRQPRCVRVGLADLANIRFVLLRALQLLL